ncbi:MAG: rhomboid family intramembrane serine protease [Acidobacteriota bacterium]|nr:rhomboid family intramembrane serine protease [Acidobacteriota bacterium]
MLSFPDFRGATRRLILANLGAYFLLLILHFAAPVFTNSMTFSLAFEPGSFLHGYLWQPLTYSLIHTSLLGTFFELLSLWFLAGLLESMHDDGWVMGLFAISVLGTAAAALFLYLVSFASGDSGVVVMTGCFGGIFGLLVAIGILHGDMEFMMFPLPINIKARYLAVIYGLVAIAMLFGEQRIYAFAQLGGAFAGWLFIRMAPRRGFGFALSERWYGMRNGYYRWKRRRTARKFEVYMKKQGRTVRFDGQGHLIDEDDDKKRWN